MDLQGWAFLFDPSSLRPRLALRQLATALHRLAEAQRLKPHGLVGACFFGGLEVAEFFEVFGVFLVEGYGEVGQNLNFFTDV